MLEIKITVHVEKVQKRENRIIQKNINLALDKFLRPSSIELPHIYIEEDIAVEKNMEKA